jgi:O-antigen ligase
MNSTQGGYHRVALGLLLLAAAVPWRYYGSFPLVASLSVLDVAVALAAIVLVARMAMLGDVDVGDPWAAALLAVLPVLCVTSLLWTTRLSATAVETVSYAECVVAYVFAVSQTRGLPAWRIVRMLRRFLYALLIPPVLMLLHVPGFAPQQPGLKPSDGNYLSYFSRLSHPFLGRSNNLATILLLLCVVLIHWAWTHRDIATDLAALLCTAGIILTISRGAIVALLAAALCAVLVPARPRRSRERRSIVVAVAAGVVLAALATSYYLLNPTTREFFGGRLSDSNIALREVRFSVGLDQLVLRPFLGFGAGAVPGGDLAIAGGVHNTYLQQLLAYGVVLGFAGVLSLLALAVHFLWRRPAGVRRAVGLTVVALLVDFAVESSFEGSALRVIIYLLLGMLVGLVRADEAEASVPSPDEQLAGGGSIPAVGQPVA